MFSFKALERAFKEATLERDKEHVTPYIWDNPEKFRLAQYKNDLDYSYLRWTLDTKEDYELINEIYKELYDGKNKFYLDDILKLLERKPELKKINQHIKQKEV